MTAYGLLILAFCTYTSAGENHIWTIGRISLALQFTAAQRRLCINAPRHPPHPQTAADVAVLITYCAAATTPFVISSGLHDLDGRSQISGTVRNDMRDIAYVEVAPDRRTVRIGGGVLGGKLLEELEKQQLMPATGIAPTVRLASWAM